MQPLIHPIKNWPALPRLNPMDLNKSKFDHVNKESNFTVEVYWCHSRLRSNPPLRAIY